MKENLKLAVDLKTSISKMSFFFFLCKLKLKKAKIKREATPEQEREKTHVSPLGARETTRD
jgi:hypothetical protein